MNMNKNKGFTLIELLVVIAIIGILSSVVLASLNTARNKGNDAATKNNLANLRPQAEMWYELNSGSYLNLCTQTTPAQMLSSAGNSSGGTVACNAVAGAWAASAPLKSETGYWCVDSTGASKKVTTALSTNTVCPTS